MVTWLHRKRYSLTVKEDGHLMHHIKPVHNCSGFNTLLHVIGGRENVA